MKALPLLLLVGLPFPFPAQAQGDDATKLFKSLEPSVVLITDEEGGGSGVVISPDGLILTNYHVANTPLPMTVEAIVEENGKTVRKEFPNAKLQKVHARNDLALLKVDAAGCRFKPAQLSKSAADTQAGGTCFALGFPFLPNQDKPAITITKGIISSAKRVVNDIPYIQLDAAINPGNSGGALVNDKGVLIGIPTLRFEGADRIGMATPVAGIRMDHFGDPKDRKGDPAEAKRLSNIASALYTRDVFSLGTDDDAVVVAVYLQRQALALDPNNPAWSLALATMYWRLEKYSLSRIYAENAVRIDPRNFDARMMLADVFSALKEPAKAAAQRIECLPDLKESTDAGDRKSLFERLAADLSAGGDHARAVYVVSWGQALMGGEPGPALRLVLQTAEQSLPEALIRETMAKTGGHGIEDMNAFVRKASAAGVPAAKSSPPGDEANPGRTAMLRTTGISKVGFKSGVKASMADAPRGVVFHEEQGTLEWNPPPFSKAREARVLFLLKNPDGSEEFQIHTIRRGD